MATLFGGLVATLFMERTYYQNSGQAVVFNVPSWVAERSKAPVLGTGLFEGVGSNPTSIILKRVLFSNARGRNVCGKRLVKVWSISLRFVT